MDGNRKKIKKKMKTFKESIIDIPRRTYAPGIFDNADTDNPRLKQSIIDIIKSDMEKHVEKYGSVERLIIEVKPKKQTVPPKEPQRKTKRYLNEVKTWGVNSAKWKYAVEWCKDNGMNFKILTEDDLGIRYK